MLGQRSFDGSNAVAIYACCFCKASAAFFCISCETERTIKSGSFVAPSTRSVTLPIAQRSRPPRPWVAIAIRSQLPVNRLPSSSSPYSAALMRVANSCLFSVITLY